MILKVNWKPSSKELREFGIVLAVGTSVLGGLLFWRGHPSAAGWVAGIGVSVGLLAVVAPPLARPFYWLWMGLGFVMGSIISRIVMAIVFFCVLTPMAILFRMVGRDALKRKAVGSSYWAEHPAIKDKSYYKRLF